MLKLIRVYDMDGTIVDSSHRYRTDESGQRIDLQHWRDNSHKAYQDGLLPLAEQYKADLINPEVYPVIATARVMGSEDWRFVADKLGAPAAFIHRRGENDSRGGVALKMAGLRKLLGLRQFHALPVEVYEDNAAYLKGMCDELHQMGRDVMGFYIPSVQGH